MNNFSEHWWIWAVALIVILVFIWLLRARGSGVSDSVETDLTEDSHAESPTEYLGAAPSTGAVGLRAQPEPVAPDTTSETEAALKRASTPAPAPEPISAAPTEPEAPVPATDPAPAVPVPEAATPVSPPAGVEADNLRLMKGVGPKLAARLNELGITRFEQIAGWSDQDLTAIDQQLGTFKGRPKRDNWIDQAGYLARGDKTGFEAKYGALGG